MNTNQSVNDPLSKGWAQVRGDLITCFQRFPIASLLHLRESFPRLIRGHYHKAGGGCIFHILSEVLPQTIDSRFDLIRYFTGRNATECDAPDYLPAKHIVKIWDGDLSQRATRNRYPGVESLGRSFLRTVLLETIELRLRKTALARAARSRPRRSAMATVTAFLGLFF